MVWLIAWRAWAGCMRSSAGRRRRARYRAKSWRAAISATVKAYTQFTGPMEANRESKEGTIERHTNMRQGDLILWERNLVASGNGEELVVAVTQSIEVLLKEFFADYLIAQK